MKVIYGLYLDRDKNRYIYDMILSIMSLEHYNNAKIENYIVLTNTAEQVRRLVNFYLGEIKSKIVILQDTTFVDIVDSVCGNKGAHKYLTRGIFYRLQALCTFKNMLYLDTDVICHGKIKLPKYDKHKDIIKNINDSSCICYTYKGINEKDMLYYIQYHKKHINELEFPDECIIHDGFGYMERLYDFKTLEHFGNTDYYEHNVFNMDLWNELYEYLKRTNKVDIGMFNGYFRSPRYSFVHKEINDC